MKIISCDEAIAEIAEVLAEYSGEGIAELYTQVCNGKATYTSDSMIEVNEEGE